VSVMTERIEVAFEDEYRRLTHEGVEKLLSQSLAELLFLVYRRGYIRGHSDRSREVQQAEEQALREGRVPMGVSIKYENDRLILGGKDVTPEGTKPDPTTRERSAHDQPRRTRAYRADPGSAGADNPGDRHDARH
jgi:hypothetical protein